MARFKVASFVLVSAIGLTLSPAQAQTIKLDNVRLSARDVCGDNAAQYCATTDLYRRVRVPFPLDRKGEDWSDLVLFDVLGKIYDPAMRLTKTNLSNCSRTGVSPFTRSDLTIDNAPTTIEARNTVVSRAYATANVNYSALLSGAGITRATPQLTAELRTSFERRANGTYDAKGQFYRAVLSNDVIEQLKAEEPSVDRLKACATLFSAKRTYGFIWSISILRLDSAELTSNIASVITADLTASLKAANPAANIAEFTAGVNREVTKFLLIRKGVQYRVISFDYY